jgi:anti-sigma factor RsiW
MNHVTDRLAAHMAGELLPEESAAVREHLAVCSACRLAAAEYEEIWNLMEPEAVAVHPGPSVWPSVRERTLGSRSTWFFGPRGWVRRGLAAAAVAAGLALGLLAPGAGIDAQWNDAAASDLLLAASSLEDGSGESGLAGIWLAAGTDVEEARP